MLLQGPVEVRFPRRAGPNPPSPSSTGPPLDTHHFRHRQGNLEPIGGRLLPATQDEIDSVRSYMEWQAPDLTVEFVQKVYCEQVLSHRHDVWDVHTNKDRWWIITNPTNLYSQEQFPNMDLALTFHVGLCLRVPRSDRQGVSDVPIEPFAECVRCIEEASEAVRYAEEVADYQSIGVRCREALLAFTNVAQVMLPWIGDGEAPKRADFKGWVDHVCNVAMAGESQKERRRLFKALLTSAWDFSNWLTHTKTSKWNDAEAAVESMSNAVLLAMSALIQHAHGVPEACPACGSHRLAPERGYDPTDESEWERPTCTKCDWTGAAVRIERTPRPPAENDDRPPPTGECVIPTVPLRKLKRPDDPTE